DGKEQRRANKSKIHDRPSDLKAGAQPTIGCAPQGTRSRRQLTRMPWVSVTVRPPPAVVLIHVAPIRSPVGPLIVAPCSMSCTNVCPAGTCRDQGPDPT